MSGKKPGHGIDYRNVIGWSDRLRREAPFLDAVLADAPERTLLDVGCGTGEHARHLAERGWSVVGIDLAEDRVHAAHDLAGETEAGGRARFEQRDVAEAGALPESPFGAAICIGNVLAFVEDEAALHRFFGGLSEALRPGAPLLLQMLNYERIVEKNIRSLGVNVRPMPEGEGDGELVFLRVFRARPGERALDFYPMTLRLLPGGDPPVEVRPAQEAIHYGWRRAELEDVLAATGFEEPRVLGTLAEEPFRPLESPDLVIVTRRK